MPLAIFLCFFFLRTVSDSEEKQAVLSALCCKLEEVLLGCRMCVDTMLELVQQMKAVGRLHKETAPLFTTWPAMKFGNFFL